MHTCIHHSVRERHRQTDRQTDRRGVGCVGGEGERDELYGLKH